MNNNNHAPNSPLAHADRLRSIAGELTEVHSLLSVLCNELEGGGIIKARHLEPVIAEAVPKLRDAVQAMNSLTMERRTRPRYWTRPDQNPLLM